MYYPMGCEEARRIFLNGDKFLVYYDPDNDGLCSGYLCEVFLKALGKPFSWYINENREHGFLIPKDKWNNLKGYTVFAVDFSMSVEDIVELTDIGVNIINIDHHNILLDKLFTYKSNISGAESVIINNQYCFEPTEFKFLSGAGMVYYVLGSMMSGFMNENTKALVGISLLTDIREIENKYAEDFLCSTYKNDSKKFQYLVELTRGNFDGGWGYQNMDRNFIDYYFSPKLNALFRLNKGDLAISIIRGDFPVEQRQDLNVYKDIQNSVIDRIMSNLKGYEGKSLICKYVDEEVECFSTCKLANYIGVACSRVKNFGKTTFLYVKSRDGSILRGSVRGKFDNVDYLSIFRKFGFDCDGHKVAFGVKSCDINNLDLNELDQAIKVAEIEGEATQYNNRLFNISNLKFFLTGPNSAIARKNNFLRDSKRILLKYTGNNYTVEEKGKMWVYTVDGIPVKCFDEDLNLSNGLILPLAERSGFIQCYLRRPN